MIFRNENPNLGQTTTVNEQGLTSISSSKVTSNDNKPTTRELVDVTIQAAGQHITQWFYLAPWKCQVVAVRENHVVASASGTLDVIRVQADSVAPAAANGGTLISMLTGPMSTAGTANTRQSLALSTASGSPTILNPGDQLALVTSGSATGYAGGIVQVEIVQLG